MMDDPFIVDPLRHSRGDGDRDRDGDDGDRAVVDYPLCADDGDGDGDGAADDTNACIYSEPVLYMAARDRPYGVFRANLTPPKELMACRTPKFQLLPRVQAVAQFGAPAFAIAAVAAATPPAAAIPAVTAVTTSTTLSGPPSDWDDIVHRLCAQRILSASPSTASSGALVYPPAIRFMIASYCVPLVHMGRWYERHGRWHDGAYYGYTQSMIYEHHPYAAYKVIPSRVQYAPSVTVALL